MSTSIRSCLKCNNDFESTGSGNRICHHCIRNNRDKYTASSSEYVSSPRRKEADHDSNREESDA